MNFFVKVKYYFPYFLLWAPVFLLVSCSGENTPDCLQRAGDPVRVELDLAPFNRVTVFEQVRLVVRYGPVQKVELETGEFLRNEVKAEVSDGRLLVRNDNSCNLFRDYGLTTLYITVPDLLEIRSSTGLPIKSDGALPFNSLTLYSESFNDPGAKTTDGSFILELAVGSVHIVANGIAYFELSGSAGVANFTIAAGDSRIEAAQLVAEEVSLNHRGSNDMEVNPQSALRGVIRGTGNVVSYNRPETIAVDILYKGRLIFRD